MKIVYIRVDLKFLQIYTPLLLRLPAVQLFEK